MSENILVTGGAGYIGSHACKALAKAGFTPITFDNLVHGHADAVRWGPLERGDLLDHDHLVDVMQRYQPKAVIHFAAYAYVGESVTDPAKYYRNNVTGTLSLLDAMRTAEVDRLVFSSTCATYGIPSTNAINEDHPQRPVNPYGHSKLMIEQILRDYGQAYGLRSIALRYFNAAGADAATEIGEDHTPETHLIPLLLRAAGNPNSPITVFGNDYPTPDGTCIRDYIHVEDLVNAHLLAVEKLADSSGFTAFNLGTGKGHSVQEMIAATQRVTGKQVHIIEGPRRAGDPPQLVADARKAQSQLGWVPVWQDMDAIIDSAWRWHQHLDRLNTDK